MNSTINLTGIKAIGRHGANTGERDQVQTFYLDIEVDITIAHDELDSTIDYRDVTAVARRLIEQKQFNLIETMAAAVAKKIYILGSINRVKVVVHKPSAAKSMLIDDVTAMVEVTGS